MSNLTRKSLPLPHTIIEFPEAENANDGDCGRWAISLGLWGLFLREFFMRKVRLWLLVFDGLAILQAEPLDDVRDPAKSDRLDGGSKVSFRGLTGMGKSMILGIGIGTLSDSA